ncbi:hypothetical protein M011DRAFT_474566 [Sporormia fimetaria CBS 119925]|uniref:Uncharacterized protein n=1 Tax=Sporormia fimetaria CBS 119925 TaxID=1340428 RepID=A0A6A6VK32_9PLEO|nr:hypothetical protein M011DRAFT_474566 [Sporormia fimetaria CBS 119925]
MLPPPGYMIWANEPIPVANHTEPACFPSEFMSEYRSVSSGVAGSSVVPAMGGFACPEGYCTNMVAKDNYIACCPSAYKLHLPDTTIDPNRPAYGATCYSDLVVSFTYTVTAYNASGETDVQQWVASTAGAQAYAHPIDGFALSSATVGCAAASSPPASSPPPPTEESTSPGVIAGASVGAVCGLAIIVALVWALLYRRRRRRTRATQDDLPDSEKSDEYYFHMDDKARIYEAAGSVVCEKDIDKVHVVEKESTMITEMEGSPATPTFKEKKPRPSEEGPFEMAGDTIQDVDEEKKNDLKEKQ